MHRFEFTASVQTGNIDFDAHCRTLLEMANTILDPQGLRASPDRLRPAVKSLLAYLDYHLLSEELAMAYAKYPDRSFHTSFHRQIRYIAGEIDTQMLRPAEASESIFFLIEDWLVYHVLSADRRLANFLRHTPATGTLLRLPTIRDLKTEGSLPPEFDEHLGEIGLGSYP